MKDFKLPQEFKEEQVEKLMIKLFPEYKFKWTGLKKKPKFSKNKGSLLTSAILKKNTFNIFLINLKTDANGSKFLLRDAGWHGLFVFIFTLFTGFLPMIIILLIMKVTVFNKRNNEFDEIVKEELNKINN